MTSSRLGRLGVPLGVGAAVLALVLATLVDRGGDGRPARLPIGLSSGGDSRTSGEAAGAPAADSDRAYYGGNVTYRFASGTLEGLAKEGKAYTLSTGRADHDDVVRLAAALGLDGEPTHVEGAWLVREGSRELRVGDDPGNPWYFSPYAFVGCVSSGSSSSGSGSSTNGSTDAPPPPDGAEPAIAPSTEPGTLPPDAPEPDSRCVKGEVPPAPAMPPIADPGEPMATEEKPAAACAAPPPGTEPSPCHDTPTPVDQPVGEPTSSAGGGSTGSTGSSGSGVACGCPEGVKCACAEPSPLALGPESEARAKAQALLAASGHDDVTLRVDRGYDAWYISGDIFVGGLRTVGFGVHVGIDAKGEIRDASGWLGSASGADTYPLLDPEAAAERNPWGGIRPMIACDAITPECEQPEEVVRDVTAVELGLLFAPVLSSDEQDAYLVPAWLLTMKDQQTYPEAVLALPDEYIQQPQPVDGGGCGKAVDCDTPVCNTPDGSCGDTVVEPARPQTDPAAPKPEPAKS